MTGGPQPEAAADSTRIVTGREWRRRWRNLDEDEREFIADTVRAGQALDEPARAALAVTYAVRSRRDVVGAIVLGPLLVVLGVLVGTTAGHASRGGEAFTTLLRIVGWRWALPWLAVAAALSGLAFLLGRRRIASLRTSERANRERLARLGGR